LNPVDIVLLTHDRPDFTRRCIESLHAVTEHPFRLIVTDNHSGDETVRYLLDQHERGRIHRLVLFDRNYGVAPAGNVGWTLSTSDLYLRLDNDIEFHRPDWLTIMARTMRSNPGLGALSYDFFAREGRAGEVVEFPGGDRVIQPRNGCEVYGGCVMISREVFGRLGFWCEDYGQYGWEDSDYGIRLMLAGYTTYFPEFTEGLIHLGESDPAIHGDYMAFKAGKHRDLSRSAGEHVLAYMLKVRTLQMRRRYRTEFIDELHARLVPDADYNEIEGRASRELTFELKDLGAEVEFPRDAQTSGKLKNIYRQLQERRYS
jgi:glycosyltransferase involved in cell wall biosynthesis